MITLIKRKRHFEAYDERKVYASCYAAALNCHYSEQEAEKIAKKAAVSVTKKIKACLKKNKKKVFTSRDIRNYVIKNFSDPEVTFMYIHHLDLC